MRGDAEAPVGVHRAQYPLRLFRSDLHGWEAVPWSETDRDSARTCFVAMPITTPASYAERLSDAEHFAHVLTHLFTPALQAAGLTVIPPSVAGSEIIHAEIIKNLEQADFVLCDLSDLLIRMFSSNSE
jgi:hypothetical protein